MKSSHSVLKLISVGTLQNHMLQRLKSAKCSTHVMKEYLLKWIGNNQMNQSDGLSYDETLFLSYQRVSKGKIAWSYSKEVDLYWSEDCLST